MHVVHIQVHIVHFERLSKTFIREISSYYLLGLTNYG